MLTLSTGARAETKPPPTSKQTLGPGLVVERVHASIAPPVDAGDRIITLVRIDPEHYRFRLLTKSEHGSRTAPEWVREFNLTGVINASMFLGGDQGSTGFMVDGERIFQGRVNNSMGAFLAWGPVDSADAPLRMFGRGCPGFDLDKIREIGSWETGFLGASNDHFWSIPNVIGFEPVEARLPQVGDASGE